MWNEPEAYYSFSFVRHRTTWSRLQLRLAQRGTRPWSRVAFHLSSIRSIKEGKTGRRDFFDKKRPVPKHGSINSLATNLRSFTNFEHLGAWYWASALCRRSTVLHCDLLWVLHLTLSLTLHAVGFHSGPPLLGYGFSPRSCTHRAYCGWSSIVARPYYNFLNLSLVQEGWY